MSSSTPLHPDQQLSAQPFFSDVDTTLPSPPPAIFTFLSGLLLLSTQSFVSVPCSSGRRVITLLAFHNSLLNLGKTISCTSVICVSSPMVTSALALSFTTILSPFIKFVSALILLSRSPSGAPYAWKTSWSFTDHDCNLKPCILKKSESDRWRDAALNSDKDAQRSHVNPSVLTQEESPLDNQEETLLPRMKRLEKKFLESE